MKANLKKIKWGNHSTQNQVLLYRFINQDSMVSVEDCTHALVELNRNPEIDPHKFVQLISHKGAKAMY